MNQVSIWCGTLERQTTQDFSRYNLFMLPDLQLDDVVRLRKVHPCGSYEWTVVRLGADIGLECRGCNRRVLLTRRELARRLKKIISKSSDARSNA